jgi:lipopolysaccharide biosynthesis protein
MDALQQILFNTNPGPLYEADCEGSPLTAPPPVRLIAYYLPQFHPVPQNDEWWGKGFTEWTNVTKAVPRFRGHYQPRLPGELGFYDLRIADILKRQAELARKYGVQGFCIHYYWFGGTKLLNAPLELLLASPDIDLPFCLNWANENWTRTWDGGNSDILIGQDHSPEDDIAFCEALLPALRDPRYIKVEGRPLIMLYRPDLLPDAAATLERWREHLQAAGVGIPYLVTPQVFDRINPLTHGFDAAAGFPPHRFGWSHRTYKARQPFDPSYQGVLIPYDEMVARAMAAPVGEYRYHPGVTPSWDNEARRPNRGTTFIGSKPKKYGAWLEHACRQAAAEQQPDARIVFINAWNEWAEGAYLEPDRHFGYAYLAETARALNRVAKGLQSGDESKRPKRAKQAAGRLAPQVDSP